MNDMSTAHAIPAPPERVTGEYLLRWNELYAPYPWVWRDMIAYTHAVVWIDSAELYDRVLLEYRDAPFVMLSSTGNPIQNPALRFASQFSYQMRVAQNQFETRVTTLAPKFSRADDSFAWRNIPGITRGKGSNEIIEDYGDADKPANTGGNLLLGGRR